MIEPSCTIYREDLNFRLLKVFFGELVLFLRKFVTKDDRAIYREDLNFGLINSGSGAFPKSSYRNLFKVSNFDAKGFNKDGGIICV